MEDGGGVGGDSLKNPRQNINVGVYLEGMSHHTSLTVNLGANPPHR